MHEPSVFTYKLCLELMSRGFLPFPPTPTESTYPNDVCQFFQPCSKLAHVIKENRFFEFSVYPSQTALTFSASTCSHCEMCVRGKGSGTFSCYFCADNCETCTPTSHNMDI